MSGGKPTMGTDRIPKASRGWYRDPETGQKLRRVTAILHDGVPNDALTFWAGNLTAESAMANLPYLVKSSRHPQARAEAYDWLRRAHTRKRDERADIGKAVHRVVEAHVLGQPVPADMLADPELEPFLEHFLRFVADWQVTFEASEMVVANPDQGYAGTLDFVARSPLIIEGLIGAGMLPADTPAQAGVLGDAKTGGEVCTGDATCVRVRPAQFRSCPGGLHSIKGVYPEAGMQMAAYRACTTAWLRDGTKVPMPPTAPVGIVLHLRPEGYVLHAARCDEQILRFFQHAQIVAEWTNETSKTVLGGALTAPATAPAAVVTEVA